MYKGNKSVYKPKHENFAGDKNPICRSSWERMLCNVLDGNKLVKKWDSENIIIKYLSPIDNKIHRYYVDFCIEFHNGENIIVEVKPYAQSIKPKEPKRKTRKAVDRYNKEVRTYLVNQAKWNAAKQVAEKVGAKFVVFTENELRKIGCPL